MRSITSLFVVSSLLFAAACSSGLGPKAQRELSERVLGPNAEDELRTLARDIERARSGGERSRMIASGLFVVREGRIALPQRAAILRSMGAILSSGDLDQIEPLLKDEGLARAALFAIASVPGAEASRALERALADAEHGGGGAVLSAAEVANALAGRDDAVARAVARTRAEDGAIGAQMRRGLAKVGATGAGPLLVKALRKGGPHAIDDCLIWLRRATTNRVSENELDVVWSALKNGEDARGRRAVFEEMLRRTPGDAEVLAIESLGDADARLRNRAMRALVSLETLTKRDRIAGIASGQVVAAERGADDARVMCLRILHERGDPAVRAMLESAADSDVPVVKRAGLEMLAESPTASDVERFVASLTVSDAARRAAAARGLLNWAAESDDAGVACRFASKVLVQDVPVALRRDALRILEQRGDASCLDVLTKVARDAGSLRNDVARARVGVATRLDDATTAKAIFTQVLGSASDRATRRAASDALKRAGEDVAKWARKRGVLPTWHLLGPLEAPQKATFGKRHAFVAKVDTSEDVSVGGKQMLSWVRRTSQDIDGEFDLRFLKSSNATAYAWTTIECPADEKLTLLLGSDDQVAAWVDGVLVHENFASRGVSPDQDRVALDLEKGRHELLLKIGQGGGGWGFCARLVDANGTPVER